MIDVTNRPRPPRRAASFHPNFNCFIFRFEAALERNEIVGFKGFTEISQLEARTSLALQEASGPRQLLLAGPDLVPSTAVQSRPHDH